MRLDGPESGNFEDRTGSTGGGFGGGGGNLLGCLLPLVASRFGIIGVVILILGYCALQQFGGGVIGGSGPSTTQTAPAGQSTLDPATRTFMGRVLGSTEKVWGEVFQQSGAQYTPTKLIAYSNYDQTGCGAAQAAMGPFYCPTDKQIYIDPKFFDELSRRFQAPGDFAQAYVIAHEVGHHIQDLEGTLDKAQSAQASLGRAGGNQVQVGIELQADCYAGVWAKRSGALEAGDIEEGMRAAEAIGDDMLTQGRVSPESFTHGTSAQRMEALRRGMTSGDPASCTYSR